MAAQRAPTLLLTPRHPSQSSLAGSNVDLRRMCSDTPPCGPTAFEAHALLVGCPAPKRQRAYAEPNKELYAVPPQPPLDSPKAPKLDPAK